jgi:hypothetical protein
MKHTRFFAAVAISLGLAAAAVRADSLTLGLSQVISGGAPVGTQPYLTATFTDLGPSDVKLTLDTFNLDSSQFIGEWDFNFDPTLDVSKLDFTHVSGSGADLKKPVTLDADSVSGGPAHGLDVELLFNDAASKRLTGGSSTMFEITGTGGLSFTAKSFDFFNTSLGYESVAHVQAIPGTPDSGWVATPLPASLWGSGALVALLAGHRAWRRVPA